MSNILDTIVANKRKEVEQFKQQTTLTELKKSSLYHRDPISLKSALISSESTGIIAEYKRKSPSKGVINVYSNIEDVTKGYLSAGVSAQSILTDRTFFGGKNDDIVKARSIITTTPILRKDFMVDPFQIYEAKSIGADVILLIATCLTANELKEMEKVANEIGLEVLIEIHTKEDLDKVALQDEKIIGINNRNLKTFQVDLDYSLKLSSIIPDYCIKVSESGISNPDTVKMLKNEGFDGFLIGEKFMQTDDPAKACQQFIKNLYI